MFAARAMEDIRPMPKFSLAVLAVTLAAGPALAQTTPSPDTSAQPSAKSTHRAQTPHKARSPGAPLDKGPYTPEANKAYMGGGVVLEGAPGAPPPTPEPTPAGQTPRNMVR